MTFYEKVLLEYKENVTKTWKPFLCNNSDTFKKAWGCEKKLEIIRHAENYVKEKNINNVCVAGVIDACLFSREHLASRTKLSLRIDFLDWCIKTGLNI